MANPNQQFYQQREQVAYPPEVANGYPAPVDHSASTQYPPPAAEGYPLESCPSEPQADLPPAYVTHKQEPPPAYNSEADQLAYNFQPQPAANSATIVHVVESLPTAVPSPMSSRREDHSRTAACALVFSLCTLIVCGGSVICLCLSIPALILSIKALTCRGREQKNSARTSICINVIVVVCTVVVLVAVVTPVAVSTNAGTTSDGTSSAGNSYSSRTRYVYCPSYYSSTYRTYCVAYSYSTQGSCNYYESSHNDYCPSSSTYRCPSFYSSTYRTNCRPYSTLNSCRYYSSSSCPSSVYRECPSFYSHSYSTRCVAYSGSSYTRSSTPCRYYALYSNSYCPT